MNANKPREIVKIGRQVGSADSLLSELLDNKSTSDRSDTTEKMDEYYKLELEQVVERIYSSDTLRVQIGTFFGTANLTAVGIALSVHKVGVFIVALGILLFMIIVEVYIRTMTIPSIYRGIQLQDRFSSHDAETFLKITPGDAPSQARRILKIGDYKKRQRQKQPRQRQ